jgi:ribosomal protein S18 acetylase RimI-like enzyme
MNSCGEPTMNTTTVLLERSQLNIAAPMLRAAFAQDPIFDYLTPHAEPARTTVSQDIFKTLLRCSLTYQQVYTTPDVAGVAAWIPPGHAPVSVIRLLRAGLYKLPLQLDWAHLHRWAALLKWDDYHHHDMPHPHWYLMLLGVSPAHQRQGIGSRVLQPMLDQTDRDRLPCYLETSTESAVAFYQKHGFEVIRSDRLSAGAPQFWTMKREPK